MLLLYMVCANTLKMTTLCIFLFTFKSSKADCCTSAGRSRTTLLEELSVDNHANDPQRCADHEHRNDHAEEATGMKTVAVLFYGLRRLCFSSYELVAIVYYSWRIICVKPIVVNVKHVFK